MVLRRITLPLALFASLAVAATATASDTKHRDAVAHAAGGDAAPLTPAIVGVPVMRTEKALTKAGNAVDDGNGAKAGRYLTASRKYLIRSYKGAKTVIANAPPPPAADATAGPQRFRSLARSWIRASRRGHRARLSWIRRYAMQAHASGGAPAGPTFADAPTAVFTVFASQYGAATATVGMYPDTTGTLQQKAKTALYTAIILRNRLVKVVHAAEPTPPAADAKVHAHASGTGAAPAFATVMPGLIVLLDDEIQQMQAQVDDPSTPATASADLQKAIAADKKIEAEVNTWWPPAPADG